MLKINNKAKDMFDELCLKHLRNFNDIDNRKKNN